MRFRLGLGQVILLTIETPWLVCQAFGSRLNRFASND
jgi:hypothetical protein